MRPPLIVALTFHLVRFLTQWAGIFSLAVFNVLALFVVFFYSHDSLHTLPNVNYLSCSACMFTVTSPTYTLIWHLGACPCYLCARPGKKIRLTIHCLWYIQSLQ